MDDDNRDFIKRINDWVNSEGSDVSKSETFVEELEDKVYDISVNGLQYRITIDGSKDLPPITISYAGKINEWNRDNLRGMMTYFESLRVQPSTVDGPFANLKGHGEEHNFDLRSWWDAKLFEYSLLKDKVLEGIEVEQVILYLHSVQNMGIALETGIKELPHLAAVFTPAFEILGIIYDRAMYSPNQFIPQMVPRHASFIGDVMDYYDGLAYEIEKIAREHKPKRII